MNSVPTSRQFETNAEYLLPETPYLTILLAVSWIPVLLEDEQGNKEHIFGLVWLCVIFGDEIDHNIVTNGVGRTVQELTVSESSRVWGRSCLTGIAHVPPS